MVVRTKYEVINKRTLDYNKANIDAIKHELNMIDWHVLLDNGTAEECWRTFKDKLELLERQFIPVKTLTANRKKPIWMTHKAHRAVNRKRQVYRKYKDANHPAYVQAERKAKSLIRTAKREFL